MNLGEKKKRRRSKSPTQRALQECRRRGWEAEVVEKRLPKVFITKDLFGVIDIVALTGDTILGIQVTSGTNHAARRAKALAEPRLRLWLERGGQFAVWSYEKQGARGKRKVYTLREEYFHTVRGLADAPVAGADFQ